MERDQVPVGINRVGLNGDQRFPQRFQPQAQIFIERRSCALKDFAGASWQVGGQPLFHPRPAQLHDAIDAKIQFRCVLELEQFAQQTLHPHHWVFRHRASSLARANQPCRDGFRERMFVPEKTKGRDLLTPQHRH